MQAVRTNNRSAISSCWTFYFVFADYLRPRDVDTILKTQVQLEKEDCKEKAAAQLGEVQKCLPTGSGNFYICTAIYIFVVNSQHFL